MTSVLGILYKYIYQNIKKKYFKTTIITDFHMFAFWMLNDLFLIFLRYEIVLYHASQAVP